MSTFGCKKSCWAAASLFEDGALGSSSVCFGITHAGLEFVVKTEERVNWAVCKTLGKQIVMVEVIRGE